MLLDSKVGLRTPDALHLAICSRVGADLASFDKRMLQAAAEFRVTVVEV
jgi:predicted nucleic acid-binding protein